MIFNHKQSDKAIYIAGCGDIGRRVAQRYLEFDRQVVAITRNETQAQLLEAMKIQTLIMDFDNPQSLSGLALEGARLFYFMPPPAAGEHDTRMQHCLDAMQSGGLPQRIVYISTTGVYGNTHGDWVTEQSPLQPDTARARRRVDAEQQLTSWCERYQVERVILRVPGIYGSGRWPLQRLQAGKPVLIEQESAFVNRIHAEDLADICIAAMNRAPCGRVYNVSDGHPCSMTAYFNKVADAFDLPRPPQISRAEAGEQISAAMLSYMDESRRVDNSLLLRELGITLRYPDLDAGLADS
jgi:nucleoside-diphosphate-sugar epimerase